MGESRPSCINNLPRAAHAAVISGQTGCGKTAFILDLLEKGPYRGVFHHIVILCPTIRHNTTYQGRPWVWSDPEVFIVDPGERLHDWLRFWYHRFKGEPTLFIIDDCSASQAMTKSERYPLGVGLLRPPRPAIRREQTQWVALFHCKDRDSFEECLRENDVIASQEERVDIRRRLAEQKYAKLVLKTTNPSSYRCLSPA